MKTRLVTALSVLIVANGHAQTIGVSPVKIWTHNYEIQNPIGFGVSISKAMGMLTLKGEYIFAKSERTFSGSMTYGFLLPPPPPLENIRSASSFSAYELGLSFALLGQRSDFGISIGFGYSFDSFAADRIGLASGKKSSSDGGTKLGPFVSFAADYIIFKALSLELDYKIKSISRGSMATDVELPFANITDVRELQVCVAYELN
jgi:hypothetical protein